MFFSNSQLAIELITVIFKFSGITLYGNSNVWYLENQSSVVIVISV